MAPWFDLPHCLQQPGAGVNSRRAGHLPVPAASAMVRAECPQTNAPSQSQAVVDLDRGPKNRIGRCFAVICPGILSHPKASPLRARLQPWRHDSPLRPGAGDLPERLDRARANPQACQ